MSENTLIEEQDTETKETSVPEQDNSSLPFLREFMAYGGAFLALISMSLVVYLKNAAPSSTRDTLLVSTFVAWAVIPPLWLLIEYHYLWKTLEARGKKFEEFVHEQSLVRNFWMGIGAVMAVLAFFATK